MQPGIWVSNPGVSVIAQIEYQHIDNTSLIHNGNLEFSRFAMSRVEEIDGPNFPYTTLTK